MVSFCEGSVKLKKLDEQAIRQVGHKWNFMKEESYFVFYQILETDAVESMESIWVNLMEDCSIAVAIWSDLIEIKCMLALIRVATSGLFVAVLHDSEATELIVPNCRQVW